MEPFSAPLTREQSDTMADHIEAGFEEHGFGLWAVEADGRFIGFTGLSVARFTSPFTPLRRDRLATRAAPPGGTGTPPRRPRPPWRTGSPGSG
ncbi:hypothetical protein [Acrocarpospora catenulata]|uniref:hypothetical protein n=1 Tax=Acrocarpospora catenulata TaxID=2836182 RepID=UPI002023B713|nr:hypothetical protein [Acrocarpospora catenulata]